MILIALILLVVIIYCGDELVEVIQVASEFLPGMIVAVVLILLILSCIFNGG
jgi:hypothetical protein